jgi:Holliday junction resolvase RusA-like endonuclease
MTLRFFVPGVPVPQPRARITTRGRFAHAYVPKAHPVHAWRKKVVQAALDAADGQSFGKRSVYFCATYWFQRPKSHIRADGAVRLAHDDAIPRPDLDNLNKAVWDALTDAGIWHDDGQVMESIERKDWIGEASPYHLSTDFFDEPGAEIIIKLH